jgi:hypothetical protein
MPARNELPLPGYSQQCTTRSIVSQHSLPTEYTTPRYSNVGQITTPAVNITKVGYLPWFTIVFLVYYSFDSVTTLKSGW